ncbi:UDP-glycosyltransferase UGT5 [Cherax quadricarinatus]|uniref:UDP-glycosyltransferase UGT5 n=1 Tax=Cherax quadricarinatus TaxID=27406 RepID=UPI00387E9A27
MRLLVVLFLPTILIAALAGCRMVEAKLPPPDKSYKFLVAIPAVRRNHWNMFKPLLIALANRGHKVVTIQTMAAAFTHPNITEVVVPVPSTTIASRFDVLHDPAGAMVLLEVYLVPLVSRFYSSPKVMQLYNTRHEFDVVMTDHLFNEIGYPFAVGMPFITLATAGVDPHQSAIMGNVLNPAYVPNAFFNYPRPYSLFDRLHNLYTILHEGGYWRVWGMMPKIQREVSVYFPELPPLLEIERNISLSLLNSHLGNSIPVPLLPSQVEVGPMHCVPGQPLPEDLSSWLDGGGVGGGVIYFSLGSVAKGVTMPDKYLRLFIETFSRLKYRVIWKYESKIEGISNNVFIKDWLPQQDILADPRVELFITHGGLLSTQESICHGKPLIALPVLADQPRNAKMIVNRGLGLALEWEELTVKLLVETIKEVLTNPKYKRNIEAASRVDRDRPQEPLETAVFWTEYVARHRGAPRLRSPAADLSWTEFLMLDVVAVVHMAVLVVFLVLRRLLSSLYSQLFTWHYKTKTD